MSLLSLCPIYIPIAYNNLAVWQLMPFMGIFLVSYSLTFHTDDISQP